MSLISLFIFSTCSFIRTTLHIYVVEAMVIIEHFDYRHLFIKVKENKSYDSKTRNKRKQYYVGFSVLYAFLVPDILGKLFDVEIVKFWDQFIITCADEFI